MREVVGICNRPYQLIPTPFTEQDAALERSAASPITPVNHATKLR
jgi:hypothetical protein